ncbi:vesicle transport through interaction with t-SNAREs homolog 1A [Toxorhynchites rutilus septentrionalis]|uniref:vesicle transport through interaction with t-SNAREs homolog 1A n=1 Tax=Toxorhynchites rutilus septentrionalis TaxID=329112 RepID=UPI0024794A6C|nr:vesicle transport through interaction with t-SNAREs homolog 1A [Toxorhynchites rutilus septentrionalis]
MDLIQDYEQQYAVLTAEITANIGRIGTSSGAERNSLIADIDRQLEESQELLEQIGLEIREIPQVSRSGYTSRLNCYQAEWKRLQQEFNNAKTSRPKGIGYESVDEFDEIGIQEDQKRRLLDNSERLERTGNYLKDSYRVVLETEQIGTQVLQDLSEQRETIQRARGRLRETDAELGRSSRLLNSMILRALREKIVLISVAVAIFLVLFLSIYFSMSSD